MKKKIKITLFGGAFALIGLVFLSPTDTQANGTCYFSYTYGCDTGGNTMCTSCDPVIIEPKKIQ